MEDETPPNFDAWRQARINWPMLLHGLGIAIIRAGVILVPSLLIGILGYHWLEGLSWLDSFVNASMILSTMGPVAELHSTAGKLFAGIYALYSGLVLVVASGFVFAPFIHSVLHRFHLERDKTRQ